MSLLDRGYGFFRQLVLIDEKLNQLRHDVDGLKASTVDQDRRLIRVETLLGIGVSLPPRFSHPRLPNEPSQQE